MLFDLGAHPLAVALLLAAPAHVVAVVAPPVDLPELTRYGYEGQLAAFAADLAAGRAPATDAAFGPLVLDVTCSAYASAGAGGTLVPVP